MAKATQHPSEKEVFGTYAGNMVSAAGKRAVDSVLRHLDAKKHRDMVWDGRRATAYAVALLPGSVSVVAFVVSMVLRHPVRPGDKPEEMARAISVGVLSFFAMFLLGMSIHFLRERLRISLLLREELAREIMET